MNRIYLILMGMFIALSAMAQEECPTGYHQDEGECVPDIFNDRGDGWSLSYSWELTIEKNFSFSSYYSVPWYEYSNYVKSVSFVSDVTSIERYSFYNCSRLKSIEIPNSVTSIGDGTFSGCISLKKVSIKASEVPALGGDIFESCKELEIIEVPKGTLEAYKTADIWKNYANLIVEANDGTPTRRTDIDHVGAYDFKAIKTIENGKVVIIRDEVKYDISGRVIE